jgi:dTDP-4-amino-4,6-dideoxygalactose transaminase
MMAKGARDLDRPAVLGGTKAFPEGLPFVRPAVPDPEEVLDDIRSILTSGMLTNGSYVRALEERTAGALGVRNCVAVASCTAGLMLVLRASDLAGDVILPSFTFAATAHAVVWNGLRPVFADVDENTLTLSPEAVEHAAGVRTSAILATHTFGTPSDPERLEEVARRIGVRLFFDAAHAFGSVHRGRPVGGFGSAEVFSLSPTKVLVAGEGGLIATDDDALAERCRIGRDYGNPGDYDCRFVGLNARMSEVHAAIALASLVGLEERIARRNSIARRYIDALRLIPGIDFPSVLEGDRSTFKDFTILIDPEAFGLDAAALADALSGEGIDTRRYYAPPVHMQRAYRFLRASTNGSLSVTETAATRVLTLPLWSAMSDEQIDRVSEAVGKIQRHLGGRPRVIRLP